MTVLAGLVQNGVAVLGADSYVNTGDGYIVERRPKVWRLRYPDRPDVLLGAAGHRRTFDVLWSTKLPRPQRDVQKWVLGAVVETIDAALEARSANAPPEAPRPLGDAEILLAHAGRLFSIGADLAVTEEAAGYCATGAAGAWAEGSLFSTQGDDDPTRRVLTAMHAAERHCVHVRGPFVVESA